MEQVVLQGHKGGSSKQHTPVEVKNTLLSKSYAKVLLAIGEGEFAGVPTAENIYLDGTPLKSAGGLDNFGGVKWEYRSGRSDQSYITGLPDISNEFAVNLALTDTTPWTRLITTQYIDAARITLAWPAVYEQKDNGDIVGYNIEYAIDVSTNGGAYVEQGKWSTNNQKTNVEYNRTHRINLPKPGTSWTLRVRRLTPNKNNAKFGDIMSVKSIAEVIDAKLRYPNTALLFVEFDAEAFGGSSIPKVSIKTKGRLVQVPANYDPDTRIYTGVWNGTFKWAWTNNPAWVFYDLVTNERFGLGARIKPEMVDKWTLYQVSQYCDVMVSNGKGGTEPRYTCNIYIQSRKEAWQVLRDIVSIFNGMLHWSGTQIVASADMPVAVNTLRTYNRSNVIDGKFIYGSTSEKTIATTALVSFDDPDNHFETAVEAVNDLNLVQRYKSWNQAEIAALGVTSRGQAQRKGKYTMLTNSLNRMVTFKLGLEGYLPRPGEVVGVADQVLAGSSFSGRISAATIKTVTCDRVPNVVAGDILYVNKPDGSTGEGRTVQSVSGKVITVTANYSAIPTVELGWYVEKTTLKSQLYRITKVTWSDNDAKFEVSGVQYEDSKYAAVDTGARLESRPITSVPAGGQAAPTGLTLSSFTYIEQTMAVTTLTVKWTPATGAMNYEGQWRKDGGDWNNVGLTASTGFDVRGIYTGAYQARVRAINALGTRSVWVESVNTQITGKAGTPPALTSLTVDPLVFGMRVKWTFPPGAEDTARTEIKYGPTSSFAAATKLGDYAYPQPSVDLNGLKAGVTFYFWGRLVDRSGNVGAWTPLESANGVMGQSSTDVEDYEEYFVGQIKESALGQHLSERIDKIEVIELGLSDVTVDVTELNADVAALNTDLANLATNVAAINTDVNWIESQIGAVESQLKNDVEAIDKTLSDAVDLTQKDVAALNTTVDELRGQVDDIVDSVVYNPDRTYATGDSVRVENRLYQAKQNVPLNTAPPNSAYWQDVGQVVTGYGALAAQVTTNSTTITQQGNTLTTQASQITGLTTRMGTAESGISGNTTAISNLTTTVTQQGNNITSQGQSITALQSDVTSLQTGQSGNASAIGALTTRVTAAEGVNTSQGQSITALNASVGTLQSDVDSVESVNSAQGTAIAGLTTTVTQQGNTLTSQGNSITTLQGDVSTAKTDISGLKTTTTAQGTAISNLQTTQTAQGDAITSNSNSITSLTSSVHFNELDALYAGDEMEAQIADVIVISKANAAATESLTSSVTSQNGVITAQGQKLTELTASMTDVQGNVVGNAAAIESLKTSVVTQGNTITSQGQSITSLDNSLTTTNGNVSTAQAAADAANTLAGGKGKVFFQASAPATSEQLSQNLWIDTTGSANTPKRWNGSAWVAVTDKAATDAAAAAANALAQVATKADASALTALTTRVTTAEGTITSQGSNITSLTNNLTTTNTNVTAAQAAADAANTLAGGKGEVIYGSTTPAAGKQLTQNLWIDTTSGNNTPKRWNGSAWAVVTDKVATDAAAAAASALSQVATKADASALTALTTRVTTAEGNITSQGSNITSLTNSLSTTNTNVSTAQATADGKGKVFYQTSAPAVADQLSQNLWIDTTSSNNTPKRWNGSAWVAVTDKVATDAAAAAANALSVANTKADASAVTALTSRVTTAEGNITSQGSNITSLTNSLATTNTNVTTAQNAANAANTLAGGKGKVIVQTAAPAVADQLAQNLWIDITGSANTPKRWNGSAWVAVTDKVATDAAAAAASALTQVALKADTSAVTALSNTVTQQGNDIAANTSDITTLNADVHFKELETLYAGDETEGQIADALRIAGGAASATESLTATVTQQGDKITSQAQDITNLSASLSTANGNIVAQGTAINDLKTVTTSQGNNITSQGLSITQLNNTVASKADASAVTALTTRVTTAEGNITTQAGQITTLNTTVAGKADASALTALTNTVTTQGTTITSQGNSVTQLQNTVGAIAGNGSNLLLDTYSWLTSTTLPALSVNAGLTTAGVAVAASASGFGVQATTSSTSNGLYVAFTSTIAAAGWNIPVEVGTYLVSAYLSSPTAGASCRVSLFDGTPRYSSSQTLTSTRTRYTFTVVITTAATAGVVFYPNMGVTSGTVVTIDSVMVEKQIGTATTPSPFVPGSSAKTATGQAGAISSLDTRVTSAEGTITTQANSLNGIYAQVNPPLAGDSVALAGNDSSYAGVWTEQSARIEDGVALGQRIDTVVATTNTNTAAIVNEAAVRATADSALAVQQSTTQASVDGLTTTTQQTSSALATLDGKAAASWSVKLQVNAQGQYVAAGIGLGLENGPGGLQSSFLVNADTFAVVNGLNSTTTAPFIVSGGQVFIKDAMIGNAAITTAKIADGQITTAKIGTAAITAAQIADAQITTAKIQDLSVTTLKIGNEAVIVPRWVGYTPSYACNNTLQTPLTLTFTLPVACMVFVTYCSGFGSVGTKVYTYQLVVDGTVSAQSSANWSDSSITLGCGIYLAAGSHTVQYQIQGEAGVYLSYQNLMVQGVMK